MPASLPTLDFDHIDAFQKLTERERLMQFVILGAGAFAQQIAWVVRRCGVDDVVAFVDETIADRTSIGSIPVFRSLEDFESEAARREYRLVAGIGNQRVRERWFATYGATHTFATVIDPTVVVAENAVIGNDVVILGHSVCSIAANVADHVNINWHCLVSHDVHVGPYTNLATGVRLNGRSRVGAHCEIGTNAVVLPDVVVGDNVTIGAGAIVTQDLPDHVTAVGVPARVVRAHR